MNKKITEIREELSEEKHEIKVHVSLVFCVWAENWEEYKYLPNTRTHIPQNGGLSGKVFGGKVLDNAHMTSLSYLSLKIAILDRNLHMETMETYPQKR